MKRRINLAGRILALTLIAVSCNQDEELRPSEDRNQRMSEIALLEKEYGITFYKKDLILVDETGRNVVTMQIAAKHEAMVKAYLDTYGFSISPIYEEKHKTPRPDATEQVPIEKNQEEQTDLDGIFTEVISKQLEEGVIGLRTTLTLKNRSLRGGRVAAPDDFPNSATHYNTSGNWPEIFKMYASSTVGYKFMGKSRWYSGWSTRTFCDYYSPTVCASYWEHGGEQWTAVDGPYDVRATVYYHYYWDYSFEWVNH